jgi:malate dehydrogenase
VKTWFGEYQKLNSGRSSGWTSGVGLCNIIKAITADRDEILPCSVIPDGEYGLDRLSIGLPVRLGRAGVREIVKVDLTEEEKTALSVAAEKIVTLQRGIREMLFCGFYECSRVHEQWLTPPAISSASKKAVSRIPL